eukprot:CAMPEP_0197831260 /NCGR_PEP_ID=MMETSP1437-20131217/8806_1 /TAXON_ID=49252 ORGANISM="Eucampia antarctica, Strain CCMP1452" /NCGR_SAMPLE_ID=MMETSP1437 /ASSEMBLY_ACC=CAM_ASM_001096 /LENGTH=277 /DNA_ID=CAMNT_0043434109 /DNA_START=56 /DNA_END=889 /DNA_ORIENTATION=+
MMSFLSKALVLVISCATTNAFAPSTSGPSTSSALLLGPGKGALGDASGTSGATIIDNVFAGSPSFTIQGDTLKTWDVVNEDTQRVQVSAKSNSRPIHAKVEYWHTPSYIPMKFKCYSEDGAVRPLNAVIETPKHPKSIACFNVNSQEFPFEATVAESDLSSASSVLAETSAGTHVQGDMITTFVLDGTVESVQVLLKTDSRNMKARIELTQGPNNIKQSFEIYASAGQKTPFYAVMETPGPGNVVRIINENTLEYPFDAWVQPYKKSEAKTSSISWN